MCFAESNVLKKSAMVNKIRIAQAPFRLRPKMEVPEMQSLTLAASTEEVHGMSVWRHKSNTTRRPRAPTLSTKEMRDPSYVAFLRVSRGYWQTNPKLMNQTANARPQSDCCCPSVGERDRGGPMSFICKQHTHTQGSKSSRQFSACFSRMASNVKLIVMWCMRLLRACHLQKGNGKCKTFRTRN